jgi:CheY-like chemotaxis protein
MTHSADLPARDAFAHQVRDALAHLYDPTHLHNHPLGDWLVGAGSGLQRSARLRATLLDAIAALQPQPGAAAKAASRRSHRILELRYVEGMSPNDAMAELGLAKSQFFQEQAQALQLVVDVLWEQLQTSAIAPEQPDAVAPLLPADQARAELERLRERARWEPVQVAHVLDDLRPVLEPFAQMRRVALSCALCATFVLPHADRMMLRQTLLTLILQACSYAAGGSVSVTQLDDEQTVGVRIRAISPVPIADPAPPGIGVEICHWLAHALGGALALAKTSDGWQADLSWPRHAKPLVLAIDDNQQMGVLFARYLAGTPWQIVCAANGEQARRSLSLAIPAVILMDVMMPGEDGWELLLSFQRDERLRGVPIIICSVLTEPQLALMLGARAYLPKPVTQATLVHTLAPYLRSDASRDLDL